VLKRGDVIMTEISAHYWGYSGQVLRTFSVGEPPTPLYQRLYDITAETYRRVAAAIRPGVTAREVLEVTVTPRQTELTDRFGQVHRIGLIGISRSGIEFQRSNPLLALVEGATETARLIGGTLYALGEMIVGSRTTEELGGPLRIAQMSGEIAKDGLVPLIWFTAVLSVNLGLINLFPIPMLDGGHLVMYTLEALRGRPLTERSQEMAFRFGLMLVITLMLVATWNDVVHMEILELFRGLVS
jgi:regulator of sigma E protease